MHRGQRPTFQALLQHLARATTHHAAAHDIASFLRTEYAARWILRTLGTSPRASKSEDDRVWCRGCPPLILPHRPGLTATADLLVAPPEVFTRDRIA